MPEIRIGMAKEDTPYTGKDYQLRPRPLVFNISNEDAERLSGATEEQLEEFARDLIGQYMGLPKGMENHYVAENVELTVK